MNKEKTVPRLRFTGFDGEWEEKKVNSLVTQITREVPKPMFPYQRVSVRSHAKGTFQQMVEDPSTVAMDKLYIVKENDLIINITFAWEHAIAVATKKDDGLFVSHRFPTYRAEGKSDIKFLRFLVSQEEFRRKLEFISPGGAGRNRVLNKKDFLKIKVNVPTNIKEQQKIGYFFTQLDDLIALHQQKLTHLQERKKGLLQKMFPKAGEKVPELRFPGFSGDWEEKKLGEVAERLKSYSLSRDVETSKNTGIKYVHYGDIHTKVADKITNQSLIPNIKFSEYEILQKGDLILADASEDYQGIAIPSVIIEDTEFKIVAGLHTIALRPQNVDSIFLYYLIYSPIFRRYGYKTGTGMKVFGITATNVLKFESAFPTFEEQQRIGLFLDQIDESISSHQHKLNNLRKRKKALLQQMFI
ncbi:MAG: restriction endonuclease subunit S [Eubacteriaceae bacterium]